MSDGEVPTGAVWPPPPPSAPPLSPTPGAPVALDTTVVHRSGGRGRLAIGAAVAVALVAGGLAVLARGGDGEDAAAALAAAQAVVGDSESYRFELLTVSRDVMGDPDGAGSDTTMRTLTTGEVAASDHWHLSEDLGEGDGDEDLYETTRVGDKLYVQDSWASYGSAPDVEEPSWVETPATDMDLSMDDIAAMYEEMESGPTDGEQVDDYGYDDSMRLGLVMASYLFDVGGSPAGLTRLVTDATDPVVEEQLGGGGVRLRVTLAPVPELAAVADEPIPPVDVVLDLNGDDEPVLARFVAEAGASSSRVEISLSDWGADIPIEGPAEGDIDHTPWLAEEALAAVDPALLVAPTALPGSMALTSADVFPGGIDGESDECDSVELGYGTERDYAAMEPTVDMSDEEAEAYFADMQYLSVSVTSAACHAEYDDAPFDEELGGLPASGDEGYWFVQVGEVVVTIDSTYDDEEATAALAASIGPTTIEALAASVPEWASSSSLYAVGWSGAATAFSGV